MAFKAFDRDHNGQLDSLFQLRRRFSLQASLIFMNFSSPFHWQWVVSSSDENLSESFFQSIDSIEFSWSKRSSQFGFRYVRHQWWWTFRQKRNQFVWILTVRSKLTRDFSFSIGHILTLIYEVNRHGNLKDDEIKADLRARQIIEQFDLDGDRKLSREEFINGCLNNSEIRKLLIS